MSVYRRKHQAKFLRFFSSRSIASRAIVGAVSLLAASVGLAAAPAPAPSPAGNPSGLYIQAGSFSGTHDPDLEPKFLGDIAGGAVFNGGYGFNTPWSSKEAQGFPLTLRYNWGPLLFTLEKTELTSSPSYARYATYPSGTNRITFFDAVGYDALKRENTALYGGWLINSKSKNYFFYLLFGTRAISVDGSNGAFRSYSATSSLNGQTYSSIALGGGGSRGEAKGNTYGLRYRHLFGDAIGLEFDYMLSNLSGTWNKGDIYIYLPQYAGGTVSTSFNVENGSYTIRGSQMRLRLDYRVMKRLKIFLAHSSEDYTHTDSQVVPLTSEMQTSPATFLTAFMLTYPGSTDKEKVRGLVLGAEFQILN